MGTIKKSKKNNPRSTMQKTNKINNPNQLASFTLAIAIEMQEVGTPIHLVISRHRASYGWSHSDYNQVVKFFAEGGSPIDN
jgi:hypothetical protein